MVKEIEFYSKCINKFTKCAIALPGSMDRTSCDNVTVVYLLHGGNCTGTDWLKYSEVNELAEAYDTVFIMPDGENSGFMNLENGMRYYDYLADELPAELNAQMGLDSNPAATFIAGFSLGAYGAALHFLRRLNCFSGGGFFSGGLIPYTLHASDQKIAPPDVLMKLSVEENKHLLTDRELQVLESVRNINHKPGVFLGAGTLEMLNRTKAFAGILKDYGFNVETDFTLPYHHEWKLWSELLTCFTLWINRGKKETLL